MEIEVYDTYAQSENGSKIHFDVMLPIGGDEPTAKNKAKGFVEKTCHPAMRPPGRTAFFYALF